MPPRIDLPVTHEDDPIVGLKFQRIVIDDGPPTAATATYVRVRRSGATAGEIHVTVGDAVPEEMLAKMNPNAAAMLRAADTRGDRATRLLARIMKPNWIAELGADLTNGRELVP